jgi:hypothetical protein
MKTLRSQGLILIQMFAWFLALLGYVNLAQGETVAERFEKVRKKKAEYCKTHKIDPANRRCDILELKPADPLATEEGRFAQAIKIPNPVPEDSGYKPGMTTLAVPRSRRTSATAVYHAPVSNVLYDCHPRGKIQGCFILRCSRCEARKRRQEPLVVSGVN